MDTSLVVLATNRIAVRGAPIDGVGPLVRIGSGQSFRRFRFGNVGFRFQGTAATLHCAHSEHLSGHRRLSESVAIVLKAAEHAK